MDRCNELCTKEATGTCMLCDALAERDRFIQFWFRGGLLLDGVRALQRVRVFAYLRRDIWPMVWPQNRSKAPQDEYPVSPMEVRHKDVVREAHKQYSETLHRTMLALLGIAFFCLLTALGSPDKLLLAADSTIKVPFADAPMSFFGFIVVAPFLLIVLLIYLHIFYGYWLACEWERQYINQRLIPPIEGIPTLFSLPAVAPRVLTGFIFYWLVPLVLGVITWKAWAFPAMGRPLTYVSGVVIIALVLLQRRRSHPQSAGRTFLCCTSLFLVISLIVLVTFSPQLLRRPLYLFRAALSDAWLRGVDMRYASLGFANLQRAYLQGANLQKADLQKADLQKANLQDANLQDANLQDANLQDANLQDANLQDANLLRANLQDANLLRANLQDASLQLANLLRAKLWGAKLQDAKLLGAKLQEADLWLAKLQEADLLRANLQGANLQKANLQKANLQKANLQGANLTDAQNLTQDQVQTACGDKDTKLPAHLAGLTPPPCPE
jgi:uncharacterized protein YjbI with pentapeptide repeats